MATGNKTIELIEKVRQMRETSSGPEVAAFVAKTVHSGPKAVDKNGVIYSEHPRRVSLIVDAFFASEPSELHSPAVQAAWLHDVVEDSFEHFGEQVTLEHLGLMGFGPDIVETVNLLTKKEDYVESEYLDRIAEHELARIVKFADLIDNTSPLRRRGLGNGLRNCYSRYWQRLVVEDTFLNHR